MRKLFLVVFVAALTFTAFGQSEEAQNQQGHVVTIAQDTVQGNENVYFSTETFKYKWNSLTIEAKFTQVGNSSGGVVTLEGANSDGWVTLTDASGLIKGFPNDSITEITSGGTNAWVIEKTPFYKYRLNVDGEADDTSIVNVTYIFK